MQKLLVNAKSEAASWKNKFDAEATPRIEELEDAKYVYLVFIELSVNCVYFLDANFKPR